MIGYTDSDFVGSIDDRKSTSGYVFIFGLGSVAWDSKKQPVVTLSFAKAEYFVVIAAACQTLWMRRTIFELQHEQDEPFQFFCDNKSTIALSRNHAFYKISKHIDTRYHFI